MQPRKPTTYLSKDRVPVISDTCYGDVIGHLKTRLFMWLGCEKCGAERWVGIIQNRPMNKLCRVCAIKEVVAGLRKSHSYTNDGYVTIKVSDDDFYRPMAQSCGICFEHRLVMAKYLNRCLLPWEIVHHRNGIKDDNRLENLILLSSQAPHVSDSNLKRYVHKLEARIKELEKRLKQYESQRLQTSCRQIF